MIGNSAKGLTLLEVMMAMAILSIGFLAMLSLVATNHRLLAISDQMSLAGQLAHNKMEGLRKQHPFPIDAKEELSDTGITRKWSIAQSKNDPRLWVIIVEAFPTKEPKRSIVLKSLLFY